MAKFINTELDLDVEIVAITQRQAVPAQWHAILEAAVEGKWFVGKIEPLDYTPAQARWLAEELATHLLEESQIPNA